jgi:5'-nucleotidase/UDP-sugar diphosphatase
MTSPRSAGTGTRALVLAIAAALGGACSSSSDHGADAATSSDGGADATPGPDGGGVEAGGDAGPAVSQSFVILHTNDIHSHLMGFGPEEEYTPATTGDDTTVGGIARLAAKVKADRAAAGATPVLLLDAGDFLMGSPFHILATTAAAELVEMNRMGYDAITIGNHELDWGPRALAGFLAAAAAKGVTIPIVATNMTFSASDPGDDDLAAVMAAGGLRRKLVKTVGNIKIGIFGLMGKDASDVSALKKPLTFEDIITSSKAAVTELRQTDKVDLVIALSHSGVDPMGMGEDRKLADDATVKAAGGIDIIISGHTHDVLPMPVKTGNTWIVQAGSYGRFLGKLQMTATKGAAGTTLALTKYDLEPIDDTITGDATSQAAVDAYIMGVDMALAPAGVTYKQLLGQVSADVTGTSFSESGIGDLVTDAYLAATAKVQPTAPPVMAIDATGDLRDAITKGKNGHIWFSDLFRVQPLGIGPDMKPGFPLVTFYINGKDIKAGFEFSAAAKTLGKTDYFLHVSGAHVEWKEGAPLFQRVTAVKVGTTDVVLDGTAPCFKVVTNLYVASLLGLIGTASGGVLSVVPKAADCTTPVDPVTQIVDRDPTTPALDELKNWQALVGFVSQLPDTDGDHIPNVPASYATPAGRIVITP